MIEFVLYSSNANLFSIVILVLEFSTGGLHPTYDIFTLNFVDYIHGITWPHFIDMTLYIAFIIIFFNRMLTFLYFDGLAYITYFLKFIDMLILGLSLTAVGVFIKRTLIIDNLLYEFSQGSNKFLNFYPAAVSDATLKYVVASLFLIVSLKLIQRLSYHRIMSKYSLCISLSLSLLFHLCIMLLLWIFLFAMIARLLFGSALHQFSTFFVSFETVLNMFIRSNHDRCENDSGYRLIGSIMSTSVLEIGIILFLKIFISCGFFCALSMFRAILINVYATDTKQHKDEQVQYEVLPVISNQLAKVKNVLKSKVSKFRSCMKKYLL